MTREGTPLAHHVFPGDKADAKVFSEVIEELSTRFGIKRVILVGDRGMFNAKVIQRIEELGLQYIAGVKMRQDWDVREIVLASKAPFETVTDNLKVKLVELGDKRYIVCRNEEEAKRDQAVREEIVAGLREKITKGPKKMIGNIGYRRYLSVEKDAVHIDEKKIASEKTFDGIYVLRTNTELSAKEAALAYKGLWQVAGVPGNQDHLRDPAGLSVAGGSDQGTYRCLLPGVLPPGGVSSHRTRGGETEGPLVPRTAAGALRDPEGSSQSRRVRIPDSHRTVADRQRHLPHRRSAGSPSRQRRSLTANNSWKCSVTPNLP